MKPCTCAILSAFLFFAVSWRGYAQELIDPADYYPLQTGNVWQFSSRPYAIWPDSVIITAEVVGDSTMPNGHVYKVIRGANALAVDAMFQRIDSARALIYAYDEHDQVERPALWLSLNQELSDPDTSESVWVTRFRSLEQRVVFGQPFSTLVKPNEASQSADWTILLAKGIGTVDKDLYGGAPLIWDVRELLYARIDGVEYGTRVSTAVERPIHPSDGFALEANYPNPFASSTSIPYRLGSRSVIRLAVYDVLGREVAVLASGAQSAGQHVADWKSEDLASGFYLCRLTVDGRHATRILIKSSSGNAY